MLIGFVTANTLLALLYVIIKGIRREGGFGMALFFIFLPGLGFVFYFMPQLLQRFLEKVDIDREAVLTHAFKIERQPEHPDVKEELNVVPVEDAMTVSGNTEKRALLLNQLKKDLTENYKILMTAEQDEDSESAHYVASAKMEIYRILQQRWLECRREYERDHKNADNYHSACVILTDMLGSGVLSVKERNSYRKRFCDLIQERIELDESEVLPKEYEGYLRCLMELRHYDEAERLWQDKADMLSSEGAYRVMLNMFYKLGERKKFEDCLESLCKNRKIHLSPAGLEELRYWKRRLKN